MNRKKLFIYDTSKGYIIFLKNSLSKFYNIEFCKKESNLKNFDFEDYFAAILIINDYDNFKKIAEINSKIKFILVGSGLKKIHFRYPYIENVVYFDLNLKKEALITLFKEELDSFEMNKTNIN